MSIAIRTDRALRSHDQLEGLVRAIVSATPDDESHGLEWKSTLDLGTAAGLFHIAKAILAMANRPVSLARQQFGGVGYMVVGAAPGSVTGITPVDGAQLFQQLSKYVRADDVVWSSSYVIVEDKSVLIITVEAPEPGQRIAVLQKEYSADRRSFPAGTIFSRPSSLSVPADPSSIRALEARLLDGTRKPELEATVSWAPPLEPVWRIDASDEVVNAWAERHRTRLLNAPAQPHGPGAFLDSRSREDFEAEVEDWAHLLRTVGADAALDQMLDAFVENHREWRLVVENPSDDVLEDVRLTLIVPNHINVFTGSRGTSFPQPPPALGHKVFNGHLPLEVPDVRFAHPAGPDIEAQPSGGVVVRFEFGDLHAREEKRSDAIYFVADLQATPGDVRLEGRVTAKNRTGRVKYSTSLRVLEELFEPFAARFDRGDVPEND